MFDNFVKSFLITPENQQLFFTSGYLLPNDIMSLICFQTLKPVDRRDMQRRKISWGKDENLGNSYSFSVY